MKIETQIKVKSFNHGDYENIIKFVFLGHVQIQRLQCDAPMRLPHCQRIRRLNVGKSLRHIHM